MKVGIVTYHRSRNYGTMLQAYALRMAISSLGHSAFFVDYWPAHQRRAFAIFSWYEFVRRNVRDRRRYIRRTFRTLGAQLARRRRFDRFFRAEILPACRPARESFDALVFGSDQIWRRQRFDDGRYNPVYFGQDPFRARLRVSYAASMGSLPATPREEELVRGLLGRLDRVSVRETDLCDFLRANGFPGAECVLDPVFLPESSVWGRMAGDAPLVPCPYLLFYDLQKDAFDEAAVRRYAATRGLGVVRLLGGAYERPSEELRSVDGPYEFLNLVRHAAVVATSSFHGLAFALLFHRPFLATFPEKAGRAASLCEKLGLGGRLLSPRSALPPNAAAEPDPERIDRALAALRSDSLRWLANALSSSP